VPIDPLLDMHWCGLVVITVAPIVARVLLPVFGGMQAPRPAQHPSKRINGCGLSCDQRRLCGGIFKPDVRIMVDTARDEKRPGGGEDAGVPLTVRRHNRSKM
jgi:hypothetical protein